MVQEDGGVVNGRRLTGNDVGRLVEHLTGVGMRLEIKGCGSGCGRIHLFEILYHWRVVDERMGVKSLPLWIAAHARSSRSGGRRVLLVVVILLLSISAGSGRVTIDLIIHRILSHHGGNWKENAETRLCPLYMGSESI
jgi:hypothetical protein